MSKATLLRKLFLSTLYLSAFTFGGGYVIVSLMQKKFVEEYHWIDEDEMLDLIAIAQSSPGPIAVNGAIVVGYQVAGLAGTLVAIVATVLPPFVIITLVSAAYTLLRDSFLVSTLLEGMQAGVAAVIASVVYRMTCGLTTDHDPVAFGILAVSFAASCLFQVNTVYIILACAAAGAIRTLWAERKKP